MTFQLQFQPGVAENYARDFRQFLSGICFFGLRLLCTLRLKVRRLPRFFRFGLRSLLLGESSGPGSIGFGLRSLGLMCSGERLLLCPLSGYPLCLLSGPPLGFGFRVGFRLRLARGFICPLAGKFLIAKLSDRSDSCVLGHLHNLTGVRFRALAVAPMPQEVARVVKVDKRLLKCVVRILVGASELGYLNGILSLCKL